MKTQLILLKLTAHVFVLLTKILFGLSSRKSVRLRQLRVLRVNLEPRRSEDANLTKIVTLTFTSYDKNSYKFCLMVF